MLENYNAYNDFELFQLIQSDDENAFACLYERYKLTVYQHAFLFYQDHDKAQDITQELFSKLWEKRYDIVINSSFKGYIHTTVRHIILNQISHQQVADKYIHHLPTTHAIARNDVDEYIAEKELLDILHKKIEKLPKRMKEVFLLSRMEQLTHAEISEKLQVSTKTVRQQIYNALLILKSGLKYLVIIFFSFFS